VPFNIVSNTFVYVSYINFPNASRPINGEIPPISTNSPIIRFHTISHVIGFPVREKLLVEKSSPPFSLASHRDAPHTDCKEVNPYGIPVF
jgi:hypothetical protein